jgi:chitin disaccharide deacetylase
MRRLIVNADDFGGAEGLNRGILECYEHGILTSASLMVDGPAVSQAVEISRAHPGLSVGLHWDVIGEDEREFDFDDRKLVREAFLAQLERFRDLTGAEPTHVDSHRHVHRWPQVFEQVAEILAPLGIPLRFDGRVHHINGFYAQWEAGVTELEHVSVAALQGILGVEMVEGWNELGCHPGYLTPDLHSSYNVEREAELRTLIDPRVRETIGELEIELASYNDFSELPSDPP